MRATASEILMVERPDETTAGDCASNLGDAMRPFGEPAQPSVEKYWKIDGWFEVAIILRAAHATEGLSQIADALAADWQWGRDRRWAVWDPRQHGAFRINSLAPYARWAHRDIL